MNKLFLTAAIGAAMASTPLFAQAAPPAAGAPHEHHGGGWGKDMTRAQAQKFADAMFQRLDANHDGTLTRAEADAAAAQFGDGERAVHMVARLFGNAPSITMAQAEASALARFDAQDLNHDGVVSSAEREQARAARQAAKGQ